MTSFDSWEDRIRPSGDCLMHFGIKGMKHGRRRYQNEDGTWTETGLAARRRREGFGERRAAKKAAKAAKKAERMERRATRRAEAAEQRRQKNIKNLTDDELKARIARLELENKYKDLKRSPMLDQGAKLVGKYLEYKGNQAQREFELNKQKIEMARIKSETSKSKDRIKITSNEAKKAKNEAAKVKYDVKGGLKIERKKDLKQAKLNYRNTTIRGGISKRIHTMLTAGKKEGYEARRKAQAEIDVNAMKSDAARNLKNRKWEQDRADEAYRKKVEARDRKKEEKKRKKK